MSLTLLDQRASNPVAQLGNSHGYCLAGDLAHLNAEILCDEARLTGQEWALQLWTDEGVKIAELQLGLLQPNGSGCIVVNGSSAALPPASEGPHIVSMVLLSGFGNPDTVEDLVSYPQAVSFIQPRLRGTVCSGFTDEQITFNIARIENPREADNISGTLALELWALDTPYVGGAWSGVPVASLILGTLNGQSAWEDCRYTTHAGPLPATGELTLMLREWTPAGYLTRDYRALARPSLSPAQAEVAAPKAKPASRGKSKTAPVAQPAAEKPKPAKAKPTAAAASTIAGKVSINSASVAQLNAAKGISEALAHAIIAARPFAKLDDLIRLKGVGEKLLEKLRDNLTL
jgi:DNA uptake protein ComE-like DNA-binding protein